jgi:hypothetical protein
MIEPQTNPDALDHLAAALRAALRCAALAGIVLVAVAQCGCGGAGAMTGMASVVKTTLDVLRQTRSVLCTPALDPLMGNPRDGQTEWVAKDASTTAADAAGD